MAMWNLLGARPVTMVAWERFGQNWVIDAVEQLGLDADIRTADWGEIVDMTTLTMTAISFSPGTAQPAFACLRALSFRQRGKG